MGADFEIERPQNRTQYPHKCPEGHGGVNSADIATTFGRVEMLLAELRSAGVILRIEGDRLAFNAPADAMTDDRLARMRADRDGLMVLVAERDRDDQGDVGDRDGHDDRGASSDRPKVVHLKREPFDVRIDRKSKWGNPFKIGPDGDRAQVIEKYRSWIVGRDDLMAALGELRGKRLGCWCSPLPCHGDVLADLVEALDAAAVERPTTIVCPWCRSDRLADDDDADGIRCERCDRLAWVVIGASLVRVDAVDDDVDWLGPDEIDACHRCRDLCDTMTAVGGWACSRCDPQRISTTARWLGIRERILKRG